MVYYYDDPYLDDELDESFSEWYDLLN